MIKNKNRRMIVQIILDTLVEVALVEFLVLWVNLLKAILKVLYISTNSHSPSPLGILPDREKFT